MTIDAGLKPEGAPTPGRVKAPIALFVHGERSNLPANPRRPDDTIQIASGARKAAGETLRSGCGSPPPAYDAASFAQ